MGKILTILGLITTLAGAVGPFVTSLNPKYGAAIACLGAVAAAFGDSLKKWNRKERRKGKTNEPKP